MFEGLKQRLGLSTAAARPAHLDGPGALKRVVNTPLLTTPDTAQLYFSYLIRRHGVQVTGPAAYGPGEFPDYYETEGNQTYVRNRGQSFHSAGPIAVIPVEGVLTHKLGSMDTYCGMTGYDGLARKLRDAMADPAVRGVLFDFNSPGGEVAGCAGMAALIAQANKIKPVWGLIDEAAYSSACWLASACGRIIAAPTAGTGSIGVYMIHADFSQNLANDGIRVTLIHAGAHKVDGNPYEPLPETVRADLQAEIEALRMTFATAVAENRGIDLDDVLATEARALTADQALDLGLIDEIATAQSVPLKFIAYLNGANAAPTPTPPPVASPAAAQTQEVPAMSTQPTGAAAPATVQTATTGANASAAPAQAAPPPAPSEPSAADVKARIKAITTLPEAEGREGLASHFAFDTDMTVDQAKAALAAAPKAQSPAAQTPLQQAMGAQQQPDLDAGGEGKPAGRGQAKAADLDPNVIYAQFAKADRSRSA